MTDPKKFDVFVKALDNPPAPKKHLKALLRRKPMWSEEDRMLEFSLLMLLSAAQVAKYCIEEGCYADAERILGHAICDVEGALK